ncbi:MAG: hypothetical protein K0R66_1388 [Gammaproteobacteria bacterium]|jgi:hypothetical protein|nr:hypothetical protein [Gammaproteobacteria bacterium]
MSKHRLQASFKPTKADLKFARQEYRDNSRSQVCFQAPQDSGAVCILKEIIKGEPTDSPKYPHVFKNTPEQYFDAAVQQIASQCPVKHTEPNISECNTTQSYHYQYAVYDKNNPRFQRDNDYELNIYKNNCSDTSGKWPNNTQLIGCVDGLLSNAANQSSASFVAPPYTVADYFEYLGIMLAALIGVMLYVASPYFPEMWRTWRGEREERRTREAEQRTSLIEAEQPDTAARMQEAAERIALSVDEQSDAAQSPLGPEGSTSLVVTQHSTGPQNPPGTTIEMTTIRQEQHEHTL